MAPQNNDPPTGPPMSFSNNFWGKNDLGVDPLLTRMQNAKTTSDELRAFYRARADLEEEYSKKLLAISRKALGSVEMGTLRTSLDVARGETEKMGKEHALIAQQMRSECEEPLTAFAGAIKERRKIVQNGIEKLLKTKQMQTATVTKCRDRYEQDCLRVKGYLAQGHMVMGQEERKNKAKLEKTQINMATNSQEYEQSVKALEDTTGRWNKEWKAACDKFQDLEEERLDFAKSSLWAFANIASTVCVSDDASCEKVRLALENCEVEKDILNFIRACGTGQEIPDPPRYINFAKEDSETESEVGEDDNYSVAQFSRKQDPTYRTGSPLPVQEEPIPERQSVERDSVEPEDLQPTPRKYDSNSGRPQPLTYKHTRTNMPPNYSPNTHGYIQDVPHNEYPTDGMTMNCRRDDQGSRSAQIPGMSSELSSAVSANTTSTRPPSRDSQSDYSNPSSFTSAEPMSGKTSPVKQPINGVAMPGMNSATTSPDKAVQKKRSGFFSKSPFNANSPFRRKSVKKNENPVQSYTANQSRPDLSANPAQSSPTRQEYSQSQHDSYGSHSRHASQQAQVTQPPIRFTPRSAPEGEEPADPRANFQLNIGPNMLDVADPDQPAYNPTTSQLSTTSSTNTTSHALSNRPRAYAPPLTTDGSIDPVAQALANLKQSSGNAGFDMSKRASLRQPVDAYHRVKTPAPDSRPAARPNASITQSHANTPPPSYDSAPQHQRAKSALGVPQPAFTSKEMRNRTETWGTTSSVSAPVGGSSISTNARPPSRNGARSPGPGQIPRSMSPQPQHPQAVVRARSPGPQHNQSGMPIRARSPAPPATMQPDSDIRSRSPRPGFDQRPQSTYSSLPSQQPSNQSQGSGRSRSGITVSNTRPQSAYGNPLAATSTHDFAQPPSAYENRGRGVGADQNVNRTRSKSVAAPGMPRGQSDYNTHYRQNSAEPAGRHNHAHISRAVSPNPYHHQQQQAGHQGAAAAAASAMGHGVNSGHQGRPRSNTTGPMRQPQQQQPPPEQGLAMYEPPGTNDVSPSVCFMAKAMYSYTAAIPEELTFSKGDTLAVLRLQDDGWWEAEVAVSVKGGPGSSGGVGLVPSNYLQRF